MALPPLKHIEANDPRFLELRRRTLNLLYIAAGLSFVSLLIAGAFGLVFAVFAVGWVLITVQLNVYQRSQLENFHHFRQTESLIALYHLLDNIRQPLPPLRLWAISPDFATLMAGTILREKPTLIVELGSGSSTLISAYSLEKVGGGQVIAFDDEEEFVEKSRKNLTLHGFTDQAKVIYAPVQETMVDGTAYSWYTSDELSALGEIDLLIVDGPAEKPGKLVRYPALPMLFDRLSDNALILVDDYLRDDEHKMVNEWLEKFSLEVVETLANEKGAAVLRKRATPPRLLDTPSVNVPDETGED